MLRLALLVCLPASAQRAAAPLTRPVLPGSGVPLVAPLAAPLAAPLSAPVLAAPVLALPSAAALPAPILPAGRPLDLGGGAPSAQVAAAALAAPAPAAVPAHAPEGSARRWHAVPAALRELGRCSLAGLRDILVRAFDGADPRPAPPVPADPADRVEFNGLALPRRAFSDESRVSRAIVSVIDASRDSLDIALHGLALREVADALSRAKARGVRVRIVMNESHLWPRRRGETRAPEVQRLLDEGFDMRSLRGSGPYGVMHNKSLIADGRLLMAGSFNWTYAADAWHLENVFFSDDPRRLAGHAAAWRWMWEQARPASERPEGGELGPEPDGAPPEDAARPVRLNGRAFPLQAFSPRGTAEAWLVEALGAARFSIDVAMFSFTSPQLRDALAAARARGVRVRLLFDARNAATLDVMRWFIDQGWDVRIRSGRDARKGVLHHKFAVIDGAFTAAGSYNWTENADKNNFENVNFFDDAGTARDYGAAWARAWAGARAPTAEDLARLAAEAAREPER